MSELNGGHQPVAAYAFVGPCALAIEVEEGPVLDATGKATVIVRIESAIGSNVLLLPPDAAKSLAKQLMAMARNVSLGLTIVGDGGDKGLEDV